MSKYDQHNVLIEPGNVLVDSLRIFVIQLLVREYHGVQKVCKQRTAGQNVKRTSD